MEMAIVKCPHCEQEISNRAETCIYCGEVIIKKKHKPKIRIIIAAVIFVITIFTAGSIGYSKYSAHKAEQQYLMAYNDYIDYLEKAHELMIEGASYSEGLCILTLKVWYNAVYKEDSEETDKYTKYEGGFVGYFDAAIDNLYEAPETKTTLSKIENNQIAVKDIMNHLQEAPEGLEACHDAIYKLYDTYESVSKLSLIPTGTFMELGADKNSAMSEFVTRYNELEKQIPDKKQIN